MQDAPLRDAFFDLSPSPALVLGADGTIAAANRAWERLGYEPNALVGRSLKKILRPSTVDATLAWLTSGDEKRAAHVADLRASGGTWLTHELRVCALADDRFAVVAQPRQLSEEELREQVELATANWQALSSALADFVVTADSDGVVQTLNRDPPGLAPDALIGQPDSFFMPISPDERPALRERFAR
ncbi:MAG: PAS domain-containing protein, partial [Nannocystaceae bacterium]